MRRLSRLLVALISLLSAPLVDAGVLRVAVASNFADVVRELAPLFVKESGHNLLISSGSSGKLYSQIENGAPFEVLLSADTRIPAKVEASGLAVAGSRFVYAKGRLALWSAKPGLFGDGEAYLRAAAFNHLAIANPKTAPYGLAAQQTLERLGLWQPLQGKLVQGESIAQAFQFAATGNAEAGLAALSQVRAWKGTPGSVWEVPAEFHAPIEQGAALLKKGEANPAAAAFLQFLKGETARQVIRAYGYDDSRGIDAP